MNEEDYRKARDEAVARVIEESALRKMGRAFPKGYKQVNPDRRVVADNHYRPLRW